MAILKHLKNCLPALLIACFAVAIPFVFAEEPAPANIPPKTLKECYELTLKQSETLAIQESVIDEARGRFRQAFSTALPQIAFNYDSEWRDGNGNEEIPTARFTASQPLFTGFKEFAAIAGGKAEKKQREYEYQRASEVLFQDVADAYYLLAAYQEELETLETIRGILNDRIEELNKRRELGRTRTSEVANAEAQLSRVEADIEQVLSQKEIARQLMEFLTGTDVAAVVGEPLTEENIMPLEKYLPVADTRADVLALEEAWKAAKKVVAGARADYFPAVTLDGNKYTKRTGASADIDWDVTMSVEVPIFQGGEIKGAVIEAKAQEQQAELEFQKGKRSATLDIKNSYTDFQSAIKRHAALKKAFEANERNYKLQLEDFQVNLVNSLDVLDALEQYQETKRDYIAIKNETNRLYRQFQVSVGQILP